MKRLVWAVLILAAGAGAGFGGGYWYAHRPQGGDELAVRGQAPQYVLTNQLGQRVDSSSFAGKVRVVTFLFPYCTDYCPLIAAHLVSLERALAAAGLAERVRFVAFDVDPAHTGPREMAQFMREYGWDPQDTRWQFLTGDPAEVRRVVTGGYHVDYQQVPEPLAQQEAAAAESRGLYAPPPRVENALARAANPDYDVTHNDALVLVDGRGRIRRLYQDADRIADATLVEAIRRLAGD